MSISTNIEATSICIPLHLQVKANNASIRFSPRKVRLPKRVPCPIANPMYTCPRILGRNVIFMFIGNRERYTFG